jgi:lactate permease
VSFAAVQFLISYYHGPWLVDVGAAIFSMLCLVVFLKIWRPKDLWTTAALPGHEADRAPADASPTPFERHAGRVIVRAWVPWLVLAVFVFLWATPQARNFLNGERRQVVEVDGVGRETITYAATRLDFPLHWLHEKVEKVPPVVAAPVREKAVWSFNWLSATGTGILISALIGGLFMGCSAGELLRTYWRTLRLARYSLVTIAAMLALGFVTRYSGTDATLGLACAHTGVLYPFFGAMLGWLGVALTGSDTASNVLFGGLQRITAERLGLNPNLMAAANSTGGVMGKMIDAQSIVVASTATRWTGHEGEILRYVFWHSVVLAALVGLVVTLQAYVPPFTGLVVPVTGALATD